MGDSEDHNLCGNLASSKELTDRGAERLMTDAEKTLLYLEPEEYKGCPTANRSSVLESWRAIGRS